MYSIYIVESKDVLYVNTYLLTRTKKKAQGHGNEEKRKEAKNPPQKKKGSKVVHSHVHTRPRSLFTYPYILFLLRYILVNYMQKLTQLLCNAVCMVMYIHVLYITLTITSIIHTSMEHVHVLQVLEQVKKIDFIPNYSYFPSGKSHGTGFFLMVGPSSAKSVNISMYVCMYVVCTIQYNTIHSNQIAAIRDKGAQLAMPLTGWNSFPPINYRTSRQTANSYIHMYMYL